jgi:hypothetical protein
VWCINTWCCSVYNWNLRNQSKNINQQSTQAGPIPPGQAADLPIRSLCITDGIHPNQVPKPRPTPQADCEVGGLPDRQMHRQDMRRLLKMVCEVILNPCECKGTTDTILIQIFPLQVYIDWDVEQYYAECVKGGADKHAKNKHRFPSPSLGSHNRPLTVVDLRGRIVLWYLPGLLSIRQQVGRNKSNYSSEFDKPHRQHCAKGH